MKSKIIKSLVVAGLAVASPLAFIGCGEITVKDYTVSGHNHSYYVNDSFSIAGMKLKLVMSDGSTKEITITEEMIVEMPDMSTTGTKTVAVKYDGKTYTFTFQVVEPTPESAPVYQITGVTGLQLVYSEGATSVVIEPGAKVSFIRTNLTTGEAALTLSMVSGLDTSTPGIKNFTITYDGKTFQVPYTVISMHDANMKKLLQEFMAKYNAQAKSGSTSIGFDYTADFQYLKDTAHYEDSYKGGIKESDINANKTIYDALVKGVVNAALNGSNLNTEDMTAKLSVLQTLNSIKTNFANIDYYDYIVNEVMLPESDAYYTSLMRDQICDAFEIAHPKGRDAVYSLAITTLDKVRKNQEIDVKQLVHDFNDIIQQYATVESAKLQLDGIIDAVDMYIAEFGTEHALSYVISQSAKMFIYEEYNFETEEWEIVENEDLQNSYAILLSNLIYEVENLKDTTNYTETLAEIDACLTELIAFESEIGAKEDPEDSSHLNYNYLAGYNSIVYSDIKNEIEHAGLFEVASIIDAINKDGIIAVIADSQGLNGKATSLVVNYMLDHMRNKPVDYEQFIIDYCFELGLNPTEYLTEYRTNGNVQIITAGVNYIINQNELGDFPGKAEYLDIVKYLDSLQTTKLNAVVLLAKLNAYCTAQYEWAEQEEIADMAVIYKLLADITANGVDYKAHINYFGRTISQFALPEGAFNLKVLSDSMSPEIWNEDIVTIKSTNDYAVGDIIVFDYLSQVTVIHRVIGIVQENDATYYICHGDNTASANPDNGTNVVDWQSDAEYVQSLINQDKTLEEIQSLVLNCQFVSAEDVIGEVIAVNQYMLNVPSSFVDSVTAFLVSDKTEQDVETLIHAIGDLTGADSEQLIKDYKDGVLLQKTFDMLIYFEASTTTPDGEEVEIERDPKEEAMIQAFRDILVNIDSAMYTGEFNGEELLTKVNAFADSAVKYAESVSEQDNSQAILAYKTLYYATLGDATVPTFVNNLVNEYSYEVKAGLAYTLATYLDFEEGSAGYEAVNHFVTKHVNNYINNQLDMKVVLEDFFTLVDTYAEEDVKVYAKSVSVMIGAMFYDEAIDYNELFAFIELPEGVESVDYNKLVAKLVDEQTYNILSVSDVNVQHVVENNKLVKEVLTLNFNVDFDMLFVSQVHGQGTITLEVEF